MKFESFIMKKNNIQLPSRKYDITLNLYNTYFLLYNLTLENSHKKVNISIVLAKRFESIL
jgi:hypothetical protein